MINLHNKLIGHAPSTYNGIGAAIAAGISLTASAVSSKQQKDEKEKADEQAELARLEAEKEQERIFSATKPEEEGAKITFGVDNEGEMGTYNDFLVPKPTSTSKPALGGLGFNTLGGSK
jgi:6-phosphogluconolactonase (cycloisomerase 2 family)